MLHFASHYTVTAQAKYLIYRPIHPMWKYRSKVIVTGIRVAQLWYMCGIDEMSVDVSM
jgi:hypothetical protein